MNKPKRILITFNIGISILLYSCNKSIKNDINVKVENISIVYSAPSTLRSYDTTIIFDSEFYIRGGFKIYNRSNNALVIHFNNLYSDIKTFDLSIYFNNAKYFFYNYSFTKDLVPVHSKIEINANDSFFVEMETPLIQFSDSMSLLKLNLYLTELHNSEIVVQSKDSSIALCFLENEIDFYLERLRN